MVPFTPELLTDLSLRMALDSGEFAWENLPVELPGVAACWWRDADPDYLGLQDVPEAKDRWHEGLAVLFAPNSGHYPPTEWPVEWHALDGRWRRLADGDFAVSSSRECDCWGRIVADHVVDVDPDDCVVLTPGEATALSCKDPRITVVGVSVRAYAWEYSKEVANSRPRPDCRRCRGDGYVEWPTGEWAIYEEVS